MNNKIDCSIIVPVYFNEVSLELFYESLVNEVFFKSQLYNFETIFIDDGSGDNSFNVLMFIKNKYSNQNIKIIQLTRNFGQINAALAGLKHADGKCFVYLSADLQDPPSLINQMLHFHFEEKFEIVIGTREERNENYFRKITSRFFYCVINKLVFPGMPKGGFDFVLHGAEIKNYLINNYNANPFIQGMLLWSGYSIKQIPYIRQNRSFGRFQWTFTKKFKYLIDGIFSYSYFPVRTISSLGILMTLIGFIYAFTVLIERFFGNATFKGWAAMVILILVLSGIQMIMLGIIGEYLWRTFDQTRKKPHYIIEKIYK